MPTSRLPIKRFLLALLLIALSTGLQARTLKASIGEVRSGVGRLQGVTLEVRWPEGASYGQATMRARVLEFPVLPFNTRDVVWQCRLTQRDGAWRCEGGVRSAAGAARQLAVAFSDTGLDADLRIAESRLAVTQRDAAPDLTRIGLERIPVEWMRAYLKTLWAEGDFKQGRMDASMEIASPARGPFRFSMKSRLSDLQVETPTGTIATAGLAGALDLDYTERAGQQRIAIGFIPSGGEFLFQNLYVPMPAKGARGDVLMERSGNQLWRLSRADWDDTGVMRLRSQWQLDAAGTPTDGRMKLSLQDLTVARDRYLSGFLAPAGFTGMQLSGAMDADVEIASGTLVSADATLRQVSAKDASDRFAFEGLDGGLAFRSGPQAQSSELRWQKGAVYGMQMGQARFALISSGGAIRQTAPTRIALLGGHLALDDFQWNAPTAERSTAFDFSAQMQGLDMAEVSTFLGWPAFTGTLEGRIPRARYRQSVLDFEGGFSMDLFGGKVSVGDLSMERPFGVAPTLSANVRIEDLDLQPMTAAFGFGEILGRLDGDIRDLRLLDWSPIAFKAKLQTDSAWKGKRRLSQRAVNDLSNVGGSGLVSGLQNQILKAFDDFGYDRIGLGCELKENVCTMDGVGSAGDGYIIVAGEGIPRIQVVGFRRKVDFPTLLARLKAASTGQTPVIR